MKTAGVWDLTKATFSEWLADHAPRLGAALAYYTMLSVAPLLVVATTVAGLVFGKEAARGELVKQMSNMVGPKEAAALQTMLQNAYHPTQGIIASVIGGIVLLLGAAGVFVELRSSLNVIWGAEAKPVGGVWGFLRTRLLSFLMILAIGFLLLLSLMLSTALTGLAHFVGAPHILFRVLDFVVSLGVITVLFALIFKFLPDVHVSWKDVWLAALLTSVLFTIGKFLLGLYLGNTSVGSTYGAAGSLAVCLSWVYYSAQILFFGAEFSQVYANRWGTHKDHPDSDRPGARKAAIRQGRGQHVGAASS